MRSPIRSFILALTLLVVALPATVADACSVPVFRYALEHWHPDPYIAFIFHTGELTPEQNALAESMQSETVDGAPVANLFVKTVNLETDLDGDEILKAIWEKNQSETLPHMVLHSPPKWGPPQTVWSGEFKADHVQIVLESPVRKQIKSRLISGDSVVWVLLESGDKKQDDLAFALLNAELKLLQSKLKLPEIDKQDLGDLSVAPDSLKISFSALRVSKQDAAEKPFVEMLLGVEPDLRDKEFINQPMVFPVFGRGRALYALVGDGIASDLIEEAGQFLTGACQCTVKRENPGVDLLMNVDWDRFVEPTEALDASLPPLAGFSGFGAPAKLGEGEDIVAEPVANSAKSEGDKPVDDKETAAETESKPADSTVKSSSTETTGVAPAQEVKQEGNVLSTPPEENLLSRNLKLVLLLVVVTVVIATLFLRPRTT